MTGNSSENPVLHVGIVAQLVEQRTENPCVDGSIPPDTTKSNSPLVENEGASAFCGISSTNYAKNKVVLVKICHSFKSLSAFRDSQQWGFAIGNDDFGVTALR